MSFYYLSLGILGVWRITHLLQAEDGPWNLVVRLRLAAGAGFWAGLLDCFQCLSLWIAVPFASALGTNLLEMLLLWPALSAAAIFLERATTPTPGTKAEYWFEEENDVMLRTEQKSHDGLEQGGQ